MILDYSLTNGVILSDRLKKKLITLKPSTRRFVFNEDASHKQGRFAADCLDIILRKVDDIITPFPNTYIEIDNIACMEGAHGRAEYGASPRLGFWWTEHGQCFVLAGDDKLADFHPFIYAEHGSDAGLTLRDHYFNMREAAIVNADKVKTYELFKQYLMIGWVPEDMAPVADKYGSNLTDRYEIGISAVPGINTDTLELFFRENIGTYKLALAALLLLDERVKRTFISVPARQKIINGKARGIPKHELVTIDLDVPSIRKTFEHHGGAHGAHEIQIEHDVSSHWTHSNVSSQCEHIWKPFYSEEAERRDHRYGHAEPLRREACALCGGLRTRKPAHTKGDANKGSTVGKRGYKVIASKEKDLTKRRD